MAGPMSRENRLYVISAGSWAGNRNWNGSSSMRVEEVVMMMPMMMKMMMTTTLVLLGLRRFYRLRIHCWVWISLDCWPVPLTSYIKVTIILYNLYYAYITFAEGSLLFSRETFWKQTACRSWVVCATIWLDESDCLLPLYPGQTCQPRQPFRALHVSSQETTMEIQESQRTRLSLLMSILSWLYRHQTYNLPNHIGT